MRRSADRGGDYGLGDLDGSDTLGAIDTAQLNYPSISLGRMVGKQTVTRTVTNVSDKTSTYSSSVQAPPGYQVTVAPKKLQIRPGRTPASPLRSPTPVVRSTPGPTAR